MGRTALGLLLLVASAGAANYWWKFPSADCGYDDVKGSCEGQTVEGCKATCLKTAGCGGFNYPHGVLKKTDCLQHKASSTVDLYVLETTPQEVAIPVWPLPAKYTGGASTVTVDPNAFVFSTSTPSDDLKMAFARYKAQMFPHRTGAKGTVTGLHVTVATPAAALKLGVDESYNLTVGTDGTATLEAVTQFGAYHGMETLSQLVAFNFDTQTYEIKNAPWKVEDRPRFTHREVLVDTARHFEPVKTLKNMIDSFTYAKVNTMHWHLVDSQSFPYDSPTFPKLGQMGAYSNVERYSQNDVADVVEYARQRGVRVVVEMDTPGHAQSWCKGHPEICPSPSCNTPLNPATNATFDLIEKLWKDITRDPAFNGTGPVFDRAVHIGGDEVNTKCYDEVPAVAEWMKKMNLTADEAYGYFVGRVTQILLDMGHEVTGWEELWKHFGTKLDKRVIIQQWLPGSSIAKEVTAAGYRVIWSTDGVWYLDGLSVTWEKMYQQEPCTDIPDNLCDSLILGGGGEMWGETVDTSDIENTVWPRMGAIAERLWSPRNVNDTNEAAGRLAAFRCLLNERGIAAAPINNAKARSPPPGPGSCLRQ